MLTLATTAGGWASLPLSETTNYQFNTMNDMKQEPNQTDARGNELNPVLWLGFFKSNKYEIMKTFVLTVSKTFPKSHKRAGQQTWFVEKINEAGMPISDEPIMGKKTHTIRSNYEFWEKRAKQINDGKAILSIRYWNGKPYNSKQVEFCQLSQIGVQKLTFYNNDINCPYVYEEDGVANYPIYGIEQIAKNDGLSLSDFKEWFKHYDLSKPMAIIHFTSFRY